MKGCGKMKKVIKALLNMNFIYSCIEIFVLILLALSYKINNYIITYSSIGIVALGSFMLLLYYLPALIGIIMKKEEDIIKSWYKDNADTRIATLHYISYILALFISIIYGFNYIWIWLVFLYMILFIFDLGIIALMVKYDL